MYSIEGGLDFYKMINEPREENENDVDNRCLITNEELTTNHVILGCNHKFNYIPLFKDVYTQLYMSHNSKYSLINKIKLSAIICPYCRYKHKRLLPFIPEEMNMKIFGINTSNETYNVYEPNIPLYLLKKCLIPECELCCPSTSKIQLCIYHAMDKKIVKKYKVANTSGERGECVYILQKGKRKGEKCSVGCNGIDGLCKRHKGNIIK